MSLVGGEEFSDHKLKVERLITETYRTVMERNEAYADLDEMERLYELERGRWRVPPLEETLMVHGSECPVCYPWGGWLG